MCGIAGFLSGVPLHSEGEGIAFVKRMSAAIQHRGPDDSGWWQDGVHPLFLGHRRLSIVDLSPAGHQPMHSSSGRYVIVFNGEIYNHLSLRERMESEGRAPDWRGHADTETLLAGFDAWGIQSTVEQAIGMFAFAVWDRQERVLTLCRDRLGEKPLYYGWQRQGRHHAFLFGSELKALRAHPAFEGTINRGALSLLLRYNYVPAPYSIYEGIAKLPPGCLLAMSPDSRETKLTQYWSGTQAAGQGVANPFTDSPEQAVDALENLLKDAVRRQMMADVPLGAFLSGGIDSTTIVALMQSQSSRPVKTFSIGFHEEEFNEAERAKAVARHLGTDHTELYVTADQAMRVIPSLPALYDEPFSDSSQIPTYLVAQLARRHVTVSLSGDAGDELFCGYNRYQVTATLWNKIAAGPLALRKLAASGLTSVSPQTWNSLARSVSGLIPRSMRFANVGDKLHKGAEVLGSDSVDALYLKLASHWHDPAAVVLGGSEPPALLTRDAHTVAGLDSVQRMMLLDMLTYLPDDILVKVDRAAMAVSLETRVPYLDHRVVEFAWSLPQSVKLRDGQTKWVLRQVLQRHVPEALVSQPKMGFGVPIGAWLRGPLRAWAESLLDESRLRREGFFDPAPIRQMWNEHLAGKPRQFYLWDVLMFQSWLEHQSGSRDIPAEELLSASVA
ncbi:asparagine synthase (glutamine-hydrolyzing) [Noviherbaspirillum denitrificans]|uniref:asparagine synthase (glutamine-hydrolyzing) n=1 Tax=Noviherbaspirillum denitrificans TaxID=1968433 RepID=A0A254T7E7_9BURK|nr:asparagine synthase (glutamine-hydrolyzing) [Noviherbaspirillum denitrificans]OWW18564.1 asparagine synthetase B [Noviherbaspirillum denitrificans]